MENQSVIILGISNKDELKSFVTDAVNQAIAKQNTPVRYATRKETAVKHKISLPTVDARIKDGTFKSCRVGSRILIVDNE